ncbi:hypothetical protein C7974DRAFT_474091 [Boeremia exigua]|uniref:uncharacterized protein n=1 Tax=Boeremia exigua TaxID=749465 RepID=UPI001E8EE8C5|nr:uncharacterized protein C7974DRAFT_474091 [Boeremia exigua]KAH6620340.1 hypothetical protein C7974DRAFT_474091 [Boeremia exigua]
MPSSEKLALLPPFSAAATQAAVEASTNLYPSDYIINVLLEISGYLVSLDEQTTLFGRANNDPYSPSLDTLYSRLHDGHLTPSPMQSHANEDARIKATLGQRTTVDATHRPLEDFEDLYYAVLARMQDIHQILNARLGSAFSTFTDHIHLDGPSIADLYVSLAQYWDALNEAAFVKAIDCAVRRLRVGYLHQEIITQVRKDEITRTDAEELLNDLHDPAEYDNIQGLAWVSGWAPCMVAAWLEEKYRIMLKVEKEDAEKNREDSELAKTEKMIPEPKYEMKPKKEVKKTIEDTHMAGGRVMMAETVYQRSQEQLRREQIQQQQQMQYAREWQVKAQRVSEYTRYLRSIASRDVRHIVESTVNNQAMRMNGFGGPVQHMGNEDVEMMGGYL